MGRGREAARRRRVDLDALRAALDDARAPRAVLRPLPVPAAALVEYDDSAARAWRARTRFDKVPDDPRRRRLLLLLIALAHLALLLALRYAMDREPVPFATPAPETVLEITFSDPEPPMTEMVAVPEELVVPVDTARVTPPSQQQPRVAQPAPRRDDGMSARFIEAEPVATPLPPPIRLFNSDGSVLLSQEVIDAAAASPEPEPGFKVPAKETPEFMKHKRAISDERTRFNKYWVPENENLGQQIVRKYPLAALLLQGVNPPKCKQNSIAPECESEPVPQKLERVVPRDFSEDPGIPR